MAMAEKLSVQQLQQAVQSGSLPAYIGVPLIEQKVKMQKQAAAPQPQAQRPIAQEVMEEASGIAAVPSNLPVSGYNDGGIVAFAEGGDVDEDFDYDAYLEQQEESDYDDIIRKYVAEADTAGIEGIPINRTKKVEQNYASGGIASFYNGGAVDSENLERMRLEDPEGYARVMREVPGMQNQFQGVPPSSDSLEYGEAGSGTVYNPSMRGETGGRASLNYRSQRPRGGVPKGREARQENLDISALDFDAAPSTLPTVTVTPDAASVPMTANTETSAAQSIPEMQDPGGIAAVVGLPPKGKAPPASSGATQTRATTQGSAPSGESPRSERPKSAFDDFMEDIKASREDLKKQQAQDKYMAIMQAGLGMMSGTSPNAFANIGQGAQMGVASYAASGKQRAAERAALNKNLLMGQRYQSMEDIANRTADINESRYRDAAARAAAGSGDGASLKQDRILDQREAALARAIQQGQATVANALKSRFGETGMLTNKAEYDKAYKELTAEYVAPYVVKRNQLDSMRFPDLFGSNAPQQTAPQPSSGFRIVQ
jgi:hypothetical protein